MQQLGSIAIPLDMSALDAEFRSVSGISERRFYKLFYSHIHHFPLLVLGQNQVERQTELTSRHQPHSSRAGNTTMCALETTPTTR